MLCNAAAPWVAACCPPGASGCATSPGSWWDTESRERWGHPPRAPPCLIPQCNPTNSPLGCAGAGQGGQSDLLWSQLHSSTAVAMPSIPTALMDTSPPRTTATPWCPPNPCIRDELSPSDELLSAPSCMTPCGQHKSDLCAQIAPAPSHRARPDQSPRRESKHVTGRCPSPSTGPRLITGSIPQGDQTGPPAAVG